MVTEDGRRLPVADKWSRSQYPSGADEAVKIPRPIETPPPSAEEQLIDRRERLREVVKELQLSVDALEEAIDASGQPYVLKVGVAPTVVDEITTALTQATGKLALYGQIWSTARPGSSTEEDVVEHDESDAEAVEV